MAEYERSTRPSAEELAGYLRDGVSVQLIGLPGSGRTKLARQTLAELAGSEVETLWIKGISPFRDRPLAALALAGVPIEPVPASISHAMVMARSTEALLKRLGRKKAALFIDDVENLDPSSCGVILATHDRKPVPILFVDRPGRDADDLVGTLVTKTQPGVRVAMGVLTMEEIHEVVHESLSGTVDPATVARIALMSGGLPRLVSALVDAGLRSGRLRRLGGVWSDTGNLWDKHLVQVVHPMLRGLSQEDIAALAGITRAAGDVDGVGQVIAARPAAVLKLRESGLLRLGTRSPGCQLSVYPPLLSEFLLWHGPVDLNLSDVSGHGRGAETGRERLPKGVDASELAVRLMAHWRAEVAQCRSAWEQYRDDTHTAALLTAMHSASATADEVTAVVERSSQHVEDRQASATVHAWSAVYRAIAERDLDGALADLDERCAPLSECEGYLRAFQAHLSFLNGRAKDVDEVLRTAVPRRPACEEALAGVGIEHSIAAGRSADGLDLLVTSDPHEPMFVGHHRVCEGLAQVLGNDVRGGVEWALDHLGDAIESLDPAQIDGHAYAAAVGMTLLGDLDDLDSLVDTVLRLPSLTVLGRHYRAGVLSLAALVKRWEGRTEQARRLAAQAASISSCAGPYPGMIASLRPFIEPSASASGMWDVVDERLRNGYVVAAAFAAVAAVEQNVDARRVKRVVSAGRNAQSAVVQALTGYVDAVASSDLGKLEKSARELRTVCGPIYAMRAQISRAIVLRQTGDPYASVAQMETAWREGGDVGRRCVGLFTRLNVKLRLTPREREVISLVAGGMTSSIVADEVDVTRRTAETHILSAYRKIGVRNRTELCEALDTWLRI